MFDNFMYCKFINGISVCQYFSRVYTICLTQCQYLKYLNSLLFFLKFFGKSSSFQCEGICLSNIIPLFLWKSDIQFYSKYKTSGYKTNSFPLDVCFIANSVRIVASTPTRSQGRLQTKQSLSSGLRVNHWVTSGAHDI